MCEFFSWLEVEGGGKITIFHLDDADLFKADGSRSDRVQELLGGSQDKDFIGHHAIRNFWNMKEDEGREHEVKDFWETERLPLELRPKFRDPETVKKNFGRMIENYAQRNDLQYIADNAPKSWGALKVWAKGLLDNFTIRRTTQETLSTKVRRHLSVSKLVKMGKYNGYVNPEVNDQNFPEPDAGEEMAEAVLVCLHTSATSEEVVGVMDKLGLRPGTAKELLSFSIDHPDKQKEFSIVGLGSRSRLGGGRNVPYLAWYGGRRRLNLNDWTSRWSGYCRFLAFRKPR